MKTKFLLVLLAIMLPVLVNAQTYYDVEVNGIYYKLNNETKEATVVANTGYNKEERWSVLNPSYSGNLIIPETFTSDGNIYTVTKIDGQVSNLDYFSSRGAFEFCKELTSITIPKSIKNIGHHAFDGCTSLNAVYISDMSAWCNIIFDLHDRYYNYYPDANPLYYAHNLYLNGNLISDLIIPDDMTRIGEGTFIGSNIKSVTIPKTVNTIGSYAFDACDNLNDVYIYSKGISSIDTEGYFNGRLNNSESFKDIESKTLHIRERYKDYFVNDFWTKFGKVEYIEGVDFHLIYKVDDKEYKNIWYEVGESITPEAKPTKEGYSFSGWSEIPKTMPNNDVTVTGVFSPNTYKLIYVVDGEEYKVTEVKCDETITAEAFPTKKGMTFSGWSDIPETMPAKDVAITGTYSWSKSTIDNVIYEVSDTINNYCKAIGNESASGEIKITEAVDFDYSYNVSAIADNTFNGCKGITSIDMPATIISIGERAFTGIDKLTDVTIWAEDIPETDRTAFENSYIEDYVTLHVPGSAIKKYQEAAPWKNFKEIVAIPGTEVIQTYKLTYTVDGETYKTIEVKEGETITPEAEPTKEGYTFSGWKDLPETMPGEDVTVTGTFTVNKYTITYYVDGVVYKTVEVEYGSEITPEAYPEMEGYEFSGWSWMPSKMPAEDVTVTGSFTKAVYEVDGASYEINDDGMTLTKGEDASGDVVLDATVTINGKIYKITVIGEAAFYGNDRITSLTIPESIETISNNAFNGCSALSRLILGSGVRNIGSRAFANIGKSNARNRAAAEPLTIECEADYVPNAEADCFDGTPIESAILKVNDNLVEFYKTTTPWNGFGTIIGFNEAKEAGIGSVMADGEGAMIFSIDGRRLNKASKGISIIRTSNGTRKVAIK